MLKASEELVSHGNVRGRSCFHCISPFVLERFWPIVFCMLFFEWSMSHRNQRWKCSSLYFVPLFAIKDHYCSQPCPGTLLSDHSLFTTHKTHWESHKHLQRLSIWLCYWVKSCILCRYSCYSFVDVNFFIIYTVYYTAVLISTEKVCLVTL